MKTDLARIRELEAGLKPLRDANWLCDMAVALEALHAEPGGQRPAALLRTADGAQAVDDFLERLHRGVYT